MESTSEGRPLAVARAVNCLWASLGLGLVKTIFDMQHLSAQATPAFTNFILLAVFGITALFIYKMAQGRNWARITYLVLTALGLLPWLPMAEFARSPVLGAFSALQFGLQALALCLLFTRPAKLWFKPGQPQLA